MSEATAHDPIRARPPTAADGTAQQAATAAGVCISLVHGLDDVREVAHLLGSIWTRADGQVPVSDELLRALGHSGNYVAVARDRHGPVGACVGFFGVPHDRVMHSHIAGVIPRARGRHVGLALKLHQRAWALAQGLTAIDWTFDPLVRRNAYFNIAKLGARPAAYLPDFYGQMQDGLNAGLESDRLLVTWPTLGEAPTPAPGPPARFALARGPAGEPVLDRGALGDRDVRVAVPDDVERLRAHDPRLADAWRRAVRDVLAPLLETAVVTGFDRAGWYLLHHR